MSKMASQIRGILWGESTGDQWFPLTKGQWRGKSFPNHNLIMDSLKQGNNIELLKVFSISLNNLLNKQ